MSKETQHKEIEMTSLPETTNGTPTAAKPEFIPVNPAIRFINHALAGITESSQIAVRFDKNSLDVEYEPTKMWLRHTTTGVLFGITALFIFYRRKRLNDVGGLVSLAGASRPVLAGLAWTTGISAALNARPINQDKSSSESH